MLINNESYEETAEVRLPLSEYRKMVARINAVDIFDTDKTKLLFISDKWKSWQGVDESGYLVYHANTITEAFENEIKRLEKENEELLGKLREIERNSKPKKHGRF